MCNERSLSCRKEPAGGSEKPFPCRQGAAGQFSGFGRREKNRTPPGIHRKKKVHRRFRRSHGPCRLAGAGAKGLDPGRRQRPKRANSSNREKEHTSELQSRLHLVFRRLVE